MFDFSSFTALRFRKALSGLVLCLGLLVTLDDGITGPVALETDLFLDDWPLEMSLFMDIRNLCREQDQSRCQDLASKLSFSNKGQDEQTISLFLKTRGSSRLRRNTCKFPPLFLVFEQAQTRGSLFAGQDMLPLTTHCGAKFVPNDDYVLKEYLAYRIYNLLSDSSVRVRLSSIRYRESEKSRRPKPHYAFINEHFLSVAARNDVELWSTEKLDMEPLDPMATATMELFQYMIGNADFSMFAQHNMALLKTASGRVTPLPYDFDLSGLVNAKYAVPPPGLGLSSIRQRLYRGICHPGLEWDVLFHKFTDKKEQVFELLDSTPGLSRRSQKSTRRYLQEFYGIIESPEQRHKEIVDACRITNPVEVRKDKSPFP